MTLSHGKVVALTQFFTDKIDDYWHIIYPLTTIEQRKDDSYLYFYDISRKATDYKGKFSDEGLYLFYGYDGQYHLHALELAQYALACWLAWRKYGDRLWIDKAMLHCEWLIENQEHDGSWRINHKNPKYAGLPDRWPSALAQGLAISSLIRAYRYTGRDQYLDGARRAANFLEIEVSEGGVKRNFKRRGRDLFIYEEYPLPTLNGVLNGYISAIFAIKELEELTGVDSGLFVANKENLLDILSLFDTGFWSLYSLDGNVSSGFYHRLVVRQLEALSMIEPDFMYWSDRFDRYSHNKFYAMRAFLKKIHMTFS